MPRLYLVQLYTKFSSHPKLRISRLLLEFMYLFRLTVPRILLIYNTNPTTGVSSDFVAILNASILYPCIFQLVIVCVELFAQKERYIDDAAIILSTAIY